MVIKQKNCQFVDILYLTGDYTFHDFPIMKSEVGIIICMVQTLLTNVARTRFELTLLALQAHSLTTRLPSYTLDCSCIRL